jgi:hypothetical protein
MLKGFHHSKPHTVFKKNFVVGGFVKTSILDNIRIWELCENVMAWKEVAKMKNKLSKELYRERISL